MDILVNGDALQAELGMTLSGLVTRLDLGDRRLAIEVNEQVIPRSEYGAYSLSDGDRVEIVRAIGGG